MPTRDLPEPQVSRLGYLEIRHWQGYTLAYSRRWFHLNRNAQVVLAMDVAPIDQELGLVSDMDRGYKVAPLGPNLGWCP